MLFDQGKMQTHTFTDFPNSANSDEEEDKSEVHILDTGLIENNFLPFL